jgi:acyl carrier protein
MAALDEKFGVELTADESLKMTRIGDALDFMRRHGIIADT